MPPRACSGCNTLNYLRECLKCVEALCERCLAAHQSTHDPGGIGVSSTEGQAPEDAMDIGGSRSVPLTAALILTIVVFSLAGFREIQIADRDATRREQIAGLQEKVKDLGERLTRLDAKQDHNTMLLEKLLASIEQQHRPQ